MPLPLAPGCDPHLWVPGCSLGHATSNCDRGVREPGSLGRQGKQEGRTAMPHYWIQADCVLIEAPHIQAAYQQYRDLLSRYQIACSQGEHCDAMRYCREVNPEKCLMLLAKQVNNW